MPEQLALALATALLVAAAAEVAILRLTTRTAIHVPGIERFAAPYRVLSGTGRVAFTAAVLLTGATLVVLARLLWSRAGRSRVAAGAAATFLAVAVAAAGGLVGPLPGAFVVLACVLAAAPAAVGARTGGAALALWTGVAAFVSSGLFTLGEAANAAGFGATQMTWALWPAELLAVLAATLTPLLLDKDDRIRGAMWLALAVGALTTAAFWTATSTTAVLALWNFGLAGYLPGPLYGAGAAALAYTFTCLVRAGRRHDALALAFVLVGGMGLSSTYQSGLVLCGLCLFAASPGAATPAVRPATGT